MKKFILGTAFGIVLVGSAIGGAFADRIWGIPFVDKLVSRVNINTREQFYEQRLLNEESVVIEVAERVSPSVVTVSEKRQQVVLDPFSTPFGFFRMPSGRSETIEQDIGTGFFVSGDGLVVTNKHVVESQDTEYKVITKDGKEYDVKKIFRDPVNDLAILHIDGTNGITPVTLGDSSKLKVGQFVVAIGTALGEFRHTVTTGVISGLGRGIEAGDPFGGSIEELDNVIQTDAAINPGNSGGPLLNSAGEVIGVNVAVAGGAENIGFAIPIAVVKESLDNFNQTGRFSRAFLGVRYQMISKDAAILNEVPEGAYIMDIVGDSPADKAGVQRLDIITKIDGQALREEEGGLAAVISRKKVGDTVSLEIWRDGSFQTLTAKLEESGEGEE
jgi:serine protease Do